MNCACIDLGFTDYKKAYSIQKRYVVLAKIKRKDNYLLFVEHNNTFTLGINAKRSNLLISEEKAHSLGVDIIESDRGGDITYHGPGQLVAYPIFNLAGYDKDLHLFLHNLEEVTMRTLNDFNIASFRYEGRPGVWTRKGKICSLGIGINSWITYHGLALNANVDLKFFNMINPCGFKDITVTSMNEILKRPIDMEELKDIMTKHFCDVFDIQIEHE